MSIEAIVRRSGEQATALQRRMKFVPWDGIDGFNLKAFDGNHLQKTEKRLEELRDLPKAPLPGTVVARFDLGTQLFDRVYLIADAHEQESSACDKIVADLDDNDVVVADRHYCIVSFMENIEKRSSCGFAIRQHGRLPGVLIGRRKSLGKTATGKVYEQAMRLTSSPNSMIVRRISIELNQTTQDGSTVVHVLSNLPLDVCGLKIAEVYRRRWEEEEGFYYLRMCYQGELASLGHPLAALFLFTMAIFAYNIFQVILALLFAEHDEDDVLNISGYYVSVEVAKTTEGMLIILQPDEWREIIPHNIPQMASLLRKIARDINTKHYRKSKRGPKLPGRPPRSKPSAHASTAKMIGLVDT